MTEIEDYKNVIKKLENEDSEYTKSSHGVCVLFLVYLLVLYKLSVFVIND